MHAPRPTWSSPTHAVCHHVMLLLPSPHAHMLCCAVLCCAVLCCAMGFTLIIHDYPGRLFCDVGCNAMHRLCTMVCLLPAILSKKETASFVSLFVLFPSLTEQHLGLPAGVYCAWSQLHCWSAGALTMLVLIITSGYAIVRTSIPGWWIWAYWISPFAYGLRAVVINEMTSPSWDAIQAGTTETVGVYSLKSFGFFTERSVAPESHESAS